MTDNISNITTTTSDTSVNVMVHPVATVQQGALVYTRIRQVSMEYQYVNQFTENVQVWLSLPPELPTQQSIQIHDMTPEPISVQYDGNGINRLAFFTLAPGEELRFQLNAQLHRATYDPRAESTAIVLDAEDQARYLRSSPMIQVTDAVRAEAQRIVGDAATQLEQARRLYLHVIKNYRYKWPPKARGSEAMRANRHGDCGEYSWVYAALCRSLGIPCRVMVGSWAYGQLSAHVWNEVFIEGIGWMPLDTSFHRTLLYIPLLADLDWALQRIGHRFGRITPERLVFSIDPDVPLVPAYTEQRVPVSYEHYQLGGQQLAWGFESLAGAAPYLQPIYIQLSERERPHALSGKLLSKLPTALTVLFVNSKRAQQLLGRWRITPSPQHRLSAWLGWGGIFVSFLFSLFSPLITSMFGIEIHFPTFSVFAALAVIVFFYHFIRLNGVRWWILLFMLFPALDIARTIWNLIA